MVLHDVSFPENLASRCKKMTGHASLTKAVRDILWKFFELRNSFDQLKSENRELRQKFEILSSAVKAKFEADLALSGAIERVCSDDFFALEREVWDRRKDGE